MINFLDDYGFKIPEIPGTGVTPYVFSAQYQAVYDSFIVKPAADIAQQQDIMVRALVADGVWATRDILYIIANNTRANAVINWINPGTFDAIEVNAPTFLAYRHFVGNGVNQYLRTQYNPTVAAGNYTQNSASFGVYIRNNVDELSVDIGVDPGVDEAYMRIRNGNLIQAVINEAGVRSAANLDSSGFSITKRDAAASWNTYRNSVALITRPDASTGIPNDEMYILGFNAGGAPAQLTTRQCAVGFAGGDLDETGNSEVTNFTNAIETYLDYVGAGVIP